MRLFVVANSFIISDSVFYEHYKILKLTHFKNLYKIKMLCFLDDLNLCLTKYELHLLRPVYTHSHLIQYLSWKHGCS